MWRLLAAVPTLVLLMLVGWVALFLVYAPELPDTEVLIDESEQAHVKVLASDGTLLAERGASGRRYVPLERVAPVLKDAVLATEDHRFYRHFGVDPVGLARAVVSNLQAGRVVAGGSTITQQLVKNIYLTSERSVDRKLRELTLAIWLEAQLTKDQILELYLNRVYFGAGAYGVEAAAQRYFAKSASEVDIPEAAMLAGLLKAPSAYSPTHALDRARARAVTVLQRMVAEGVITREEALEARAAPAKLAPETDAELAGHFVDWVLDGLTEQLGKPTRDLVIDTTLSPQLQGVSERALRRLLSTQGEARDVGEGAVVLVDSQGAVRALVGGRSYRGNRLNRAAHARRQPGSAFKPFVYLTALEEGWRPNSTLLDTPLRINDWRPANFDGEFHGEVGLREAFIRSYNPASVRLAMEVGEEDVAATARRLGITSKLEPVPSIALGTSEVTPLELAAAYLPFATDGIRRPLFAVTEVRDTRGHTLYRHSSTEVEVIEPAAAATMRRLLVDTVERGTGRNAELERRMAGGKTGTSQDYRDAWFAGFTGEWIGVVWLGNDDGAPMRGVTGGSLPARLWKEVMQATPNAPLLAQVPRPVPRPEIERNIPEAIARQGWRWISRVVRDAVASVE